MVAFTRLINNWCSCLFVAQNMLGLRLRLDYGNFKGFLKEFAFLVLATVAVVLATVPVFQTDHMDPTLEC